MCLNIPTVNELACVMTLPKVTICQRWLSCSQHPSVLQQLLSLLHEYMTILSRRLTFVLVPAGKPVGCDGSANTRHGSEFAVMPKRTGSRPVWKAARDGANQEERAHQSLHTPHEGDAYCKRWLH
jgi:hypothetical protein